MGASPQEIQLILSEIESGRHDISQMALATVVEVEGSSYRRVGARMLIRMDGRWFGSVSGGCLEGDVLQKARQVVADGLSQMLVYDTRTEGEGKTIGANLGCRGVIHIWLEPLAPFGGLDLLENCAHYQRESEGQWRGRILTGNEMGKWAGESEMRAENYGAFHPQEGLQTLNWKGESVQVAVEQIEPAIRLLIMGAGDDAKPLCMLAAQLGWRVIVTDDCKAKTLPHRFPEAEAVVSLDRSTAIQALQPNSRTAIVLLSHNFGYDAAILHSLQDSPPAYIGILGPRSRWERMNAETGGFWDNHPAIHAPIGLDIGAATPLEIALSIVAEIQAVFAGREGNSLRHRTGTIHHRTKVHA